MKTLTRLAFAALISGFAAAPLAHAQLPSLNEPPWLGYYAAYANKRFQIGLSSKGNITLTPMNEKGDPVSFQLAIDIDAGIEETMPDGKVVMRQIKAETLAAKEPATDELEKVLVTGKVTGDAAFELNIEQTRGIIFIGGRMTDPGTLTKNPLRFALRLRIPTLYKNHKAEDKRAEKAFAKKIEDDRIDMKWTDGKRAKQTFEKALLVDGNKEINGPGITSLELEAGAYKGRRFVFTASPNSSMNLWNAKEQPLHEGFTINWKADAEKDKDGKARIAIDVK